MADVSSPRRRYLVRLSTSMAVYLISLFAAKYLVKHEMVEGAALWVLALFPGLAIVGALYAIGMLILETKDEFIRMLVVRQVLYGTAIALSFASIWGFLEDFELVAHVEGYWIVVLWFLGFGIGGFVNRRTHGAWGECA